MKNNFEKISWSYWFPSVPTFRVNWMSRGDIQYTLILVNNKGTEKHFACILYLCARLRAMNFAMQLRRWLRTEVCQCGPVTQG